MTETKRDTSGTVLITFVDGETAVQDKSDIYYNDDAQMFHLYGEWGIAFIPEAEIRMIAKVVTNE